MILEFKFLNNLIFKISKLAQPPNLNGFHFHKKVHPQKLHPQEQEKTRPLLKEKGQGKTRPWKEPWDSLQCLKIRCSKLVNLWENRGDSYSK